MARILSLASFILFILYPYHRVTGNPTEFSIHNFAPEPQCSFIGGECVNIATCPLEDIYFRSELCPFQAALGAICCAKDRELFTDCHRRGDQCVKGDKCPLASQDTQAKCQGNLVCCMVE